MKKMRLMVLSLLMASLTVSAQIIESPVNWNHYKATSKLRTTLPSSYDSRTQGLLLPVRNQMISGPCWAFVTATLIETSMIMNNVGDKYISPLQFVNCTTVPNAEISTGGNIEMAMALIARTKSPVYEETCPFVLTPTSCREYGKDEIAAFVSEVNSLPEYDIEAIKEAIMEYGAVYGQVYWSNTYLNTSDWSYRTPETTAHPNHAITLVGWNDNFDGEGNGAFILRNSWGPDAGDNGYYYIYYDDYYVTSCCYAVGLTTESAGIDHTLAYNTSGRSNEITCTDKSTHTLSTIQIYKCASPQKIHSVGWYTITPCTNVIVIADKDLNVVYQSDPIECAYSGYHTNLLTGIEALTDSFFVAIDYTDWGDAEFNLPVEAYVENYCIPTEFEYKRQFIQVNSTGPWMTVGYDGNDINSYNLCMFVNTMDVSTNTPETATAEKSPAIVIDGHINNDVWNSAVRIDVYGLDGRLRASVTEAAEVNIPEGISIVRATRADGTSWEQKTLIIRH